jgi:hypothetical protein
VKPTRIIAAHDLSREITESCADLGNDALLWQHCQKGLAIWEYTTLACVFQTKAGHGGLALDCASVVGRHHLNYSLP